MKEERNIITINEYGRLNLPTDIAHVWMTETEIVELFGTTVGTVHTGIKAIFKENVLHDYEVCKYVRLENGNGADVYNMEVVASLAFRLNTRGAAVLRKWLIRRATAPARARLRLSFSIKRDSSVKNGGPASTPARRRFHLPDISIGKLLYLGWLNVNVRNSIQQYDIESVNRYDNASLLQ